MSVAATAALLLTDVEGSTRLWSAHPAQMDAAMQRHNELVANVVAEHGGWLPLEQGEGDSRLAAFGAASAAVRAALDLQLAFLREPWPTPIELRVRMAVHTGEVVQRDSGVYGETVNRASRIRELGYGGQLLLSEAAYVLGRAALPDAVSVRDLGIHRMRDLTRPERIFQVCQRGHSEDFPPLRSLDRVRHNLPVQLSSFVGRADQLGQLRELVRKHRLVTLTGFGGIGKTRLALQVAGELADEVTDGVWFVDLSPLRDPALLAETVAQVLGIRQPGGAAMGEVLGEHLTDKSLLLVLDNLEQLMPDASPTVARLVAAGPGVRVLATSRERLRVTGEHEYALLPMPTPDPDNVSSLEALVALDSVALFVDRATAAHSAFAVNAESAPAVAALCAHLDGLPLALELAAARVRVMPPATLLERLSDRFGVLTSGERDRPDRHQTLRLAIAWSYDLLSTAERTLLGRLSVFAGGAGYDAVDAVCAPGLDVAVFDALSSLVDKSLVRQLEDDAEARYALLESVREYAAEQLAADPAEAGDTHDRHADHYRDTVEALVAGLVMGPPAIRYVGRELDNIRAALAHYRTAGRVTDELALLSAVFDPMWHNGQRHELGERCLDVIDRADAPSEELFALLDTAAVILSTYDVARCEEMLHRAREVAAGIGAPAMEGRATSFLGWAAIQRGDTEAAEEWLRLARELATRDLGVRRRLRLFDAERVLAEVALRSADLAMFRADWPAARRDAEVAVVQARVIDDHEALVMALRIRATVHTSANSLPEALTDLDEAIATTRSSEMTSLLSLLLHRRAEVELHLGDVDGAERDVTEAMERGADDKWNIVAAACVDADVRLCRGDIAGAKSAAARAVDAARDGLPAYPVQAAVTSARVARAAGNYDASRDQLLDALRTCAEPSLASGVASCLRELAQVDLAEDDPARAVTLFAAAAAADRHTGPVRLRFLSPGWESALGDAKAALDASTYDEAWHAGEPLEVEQILEMLTSR